MKHLSPAAKLFTRALLIVLGLFIFLLITPREYPWTMKHIEVRDGSGQVVVINNPIGFISGTWFESIFPIRASYARLWQVWVAAFAVLLLAFRQSRRAAGYVFRHGKIAAGFVVPILVFLVTLYALKSRTPIGLTLCPPPILLYNGMPIVLYLLSGSLGMVLLLAGVVPILNDLSRHRVGAFLLAIFDLSRRFFTSIRPSLYLIAICGLFLVATHLFSLFVFEHIPHVQDSMNQVLHGKMLALGHIAVPSHIYSNFFDFVLMINNGSWYSVYPFGHTIWMALGALLNAPWAMNPLIGTLSLVVFYLLGKELYDEKTGRLAAFLGCFSPFLVFMSSEYMSHAGALLYLSSFILFYAKSVNRGSYAACALAGAALGLALNTRPLTAFAMSLPFALYSLFLLFREPRHFFPRFSVMALVLLLFAGLYLLFNHLTTGDPFLVGYEVAWGKGHHPGFGPRVGNIIHTPLIGLSNTLNNLNGLNKYLFEWPIPCLFFALIPFVVSTDKRRWDTLLVVSFGGLSFAYLFYWFNDWCFGPRFMYEATVAAILLSARGLLLLPRVFRECFDLHASSRKIQGVVVAIILFLTAYAWLFNVPALARFYGNDYWDVNRAVLNAAEHQGITNALVFTRSYFGCVFPANSPHLDGDVVYARDLGVNNQTLMAFYPDKKYYMEENARFSEVHPEHLGVVMLAERAPRFQAVADRMGLRYDVIPLDPWLMYLLSPACQEVAGIPLVRQTHAGEPTPTEQWAKAMCDRVEILKNDRQWGLAEESVNHLLAAWPDYLRGLQQARDLAARKGDRDKSDTLSAHIRSLAEPVITTSVTFHNGVELRGLHADPISADGVATIRLFWHVPRNVRMSLWAVFLHLEDSEGRRFQGDGILCADYEHTRQISDEDYVETRSVALNGTITPENYTLRVGLYEANPPFARVPISSLFPVPGRNALSLPLSSCLAVQKGNKENHP